jgi:CheY-like chemotaxis protein
MVSENQWAKTSSQSDKPTVLVVEDEGVIRMVISDHLRGCGYRVIEAGSGDEAVAVLKTDIRIDVVFTDVQMPGDLNGFGLAQWVRRERPKLRVILTSGITSAAREARDTCEDGPFVDKPYDLVDVERRIGALLGNP